MGRTKVQRRHRKWKREQRNSRFRAWAEELRPLYESLGLGRERVQLKKMYKLRSISNPIKRFVGYEYVAKKILTVMPMETKMSLPNAES